MVMLVPFTTALPPQNDYSDYSPRNPDVNHECRTDDTERLAAENHEDSIRKPDEEPDEEDFSKVLGMLLNAVVPPEKIQLAQTEASKNTTTVEVTPSDLQTATTSSALQNILSTELRSAASAQSDPKNALLEQGLTPASSNSALAAGPASTQALKPTKLDTTKVRVPEIPTAGGEAEGLSKEISGELVIPLNNATSENFDSSYSNVITSDLQTNVEVLPGTPIELRPFGMETTFLSGTRSYESAEDTDAVTQEIMNTLSRAVAASAPTKSPLGVGGLQSGDSYTGLSEITNIAPPLSAVNISPANSLATSLKSSSEEFLQQAGRPQTTALGNPQNEITEQLLVQQAGSEADRGSNQAATRDSDQTPGNSAPATSSGADSARLSSSGAVTLTVPDLTTSVTSEMRQPLSSQVSRAVMEHLERRTTADSDTITVQLDPPDLGEMVIELSKSKEGLSIRVTAREAVTMDMLLARGSEIETQLRGEKMDLRSLEFLSPDMMSGGAFQGQTSQDSTSRFDQPVGTQRRNSRNGAATQISTGMATRTGDSQHALNFRA